MKTAFLFSGQGSQYPGMMKDLFEKSDSAKEVFRIADETLRRPISKLCFEGTQEDLNLTHNTQPCVLAADLAAMLAIQEFDIKPDAVAGFSLGEYAGLVCAGVIKINDAFPLIQMRADYMQEAVPIGKGGMAAVLKLSSEDVEKRCNRTEGYIIPANYNCPGQIVVSGETKAIDQFIKDAKEDKVKVVQLAVSAPFHCELMSPAAERLRQSLAKVQFVKPTIPIYMNVDANAESDPDVIRQKLFLQTKSPVYWEKTLLNMKDNGIETFVELGPGRTLSGFVKKTLGDKVKIYNVADRETLIATIKGLRN